MADRYTIGYIDRPSAQQRTAATLFWANSDADAQAVVSYLVANVLDNTGATADGQCNISGMNKAIHVAANANAVATPPYMEFVANLKFADGSVGNFRIPHVATSHTNDDLVAALGVTGGGVALQNEAGSNVQILLTAQMVNFVTA